METEKLPQEENFKDAVVRAIEEYHGLMNQSDYNIGESPSDLEFESQKEVETLVRRVAKETNVNDKESFIKFLRIHQDNLTNKIVHIIEEEDLL